MVNPYIFLALAVTLLVSGLLVLGRSGFSPATRWLWVGLGVLVIACGLGWVVIDAGEGARVEVQQIAALAAKSLLPGVWLGFGMAYGRGGKKFFAGTRWVLFVAFALPLGTALVFREELIPGKVQEGSAKSMLVEPAMALNFVLLLVVLLAFIGLAKIFKASLGTTRWRVKFLVLVDDECVCAGQGFGPGQFQSGDDKCRGGRAADRLCVYRDFLFQGWDGQV